MSQGPKSAEFVRLYERLSEEDQKCFLYQLTCVVEAVRAGEILNKIDLAQVMLDAARDTRNAHCIRVAEEQLERVKRS